MIKIDRIRIEIPENCFTDVNIDNTTELFFQDSKAEKASQLIYKFRDTPDGVNGIQYYSGKKIILDITGKVLKEYYPELISRKTIGRALRNALHGITDIDVQSVLNESKVHLAHITKDIVVQPSVADALGPLRYIRHPKYNIQQYKTGISLTTRTKKNKHRIKFYDKSKEFRRNRKFLALYGKDDLLRAFENTLRIELEIYNKENFRSFFKTSEVPLSLYNLLNSDCDPLKEMVDTLLYSVEDIEDLPEIPEGHMRHVEKELGQRTLIQYFDYDYYRLREFVNCRNKGNNSRRLRPYRDLIQQMLKVRLKKCYSAEMVDRMRELRDMLS